MPIAVSLFLEIKIKWVQHEMLEKIEQSQLQCISIDPNQVNWKIKNKELLVDNQFFDVKYAVKNGSKINFYGLFDHEEKRLESFIEKNMSGDENNLGLNKITRFLLQIQFLTTNTDTILHSFEKLQRNFIITQISRKLNPIFNILTPPPDLFFCT